VPVETLGQKTLLVTTTGSGTAQVVSSVGGRFNGILCNAATTGVITVYDNATAASGTPIGYMASATAIGTYYTTDIPVANGITFKDAGAGGVSLTFVYSIG
jgi:hypothetical protein